MILLIKNSKIHSSYREIPLSTLVELRQQDYSVMEIDGSIPIEIGEKFSLEQLDDGLRKRIHSRTARLNRKIKEQIGIKWNNFTIKTTADSVTKLETAKQQLEQANIDSVPWRFDDGNFQELTIADLNDLIIKVSQAVQKNFLDERNEVLS